MIAALAFVAAAAADPQTAAAFEAAFGKGGSAVIVSTSSDIDERVRYRPGSLVETSFGPVLVAPGEVLEAAHASAGKVAAIYMKRTPRGYAVARRFVPAMETGSFGKIAGWSVSKAYGPDPVVVVEGGGIFQGYLCSVATLLELAPGGPRELVTVPLSYDDSGAVGDERATHIEGRIENIRSGHSFDVAYSGSRSFRETYVRRGATYALAGGGETKMERC